MLVFKNPIRKAEYRILILSDKLECVLFDLDGTLVDTAPDFIYVLNKLLINQGRPPIDANDITLRVSNGARALIEYAFDINHEHEDFTGLLSQLLELYEEKIETTESKLYPGIGKLLNTLSENRIPWGVVTNKAALYAEKLLAKLSLLTNCSVLVCPDHVQNKKPSPEPILLACEKLKCRATKTVYIGDHLRDIVAAKKAQTISVAAAYGYLGPGAQVEDWGADFIAQSPLIIPKILGSI